MAEGNLLRQPLLRTGPVKTSLLAEVARDKTTVRHAKGLFERGEMALAA